MARYKQATADDVRTWARSKGYQVGDRGRFSTDLVRAFNREHKSEYLRYGSGDTGPASATPAPAKATAAPAKAMAKSTPARSNSVARRSSPAVSANVGEVQTAMQDIFSALAATGGEDSGAILVGGWRLIQPEPANA